MGCAGSQPHAPPVVQFCGAIEVAPWGVLGQAMGDSPWQPKQVAPKPDSSMMIVDPASSNVIEDDHYSPGNAGGASGAIYRFLGIANDATFPPDVVATLRGGKIAYKRYGYPDAFHVIHVVGPDFKNAPDGLVEQEAIDQLASVYLDILTAARIHGRQLLRILPVSSGIYAGRFRPQMPNITVAALLAAFELFERANPAHAKELAPHGDRRIQLCIYDAKDCAEYRDALRNARLNLQK